MELVFHDVSFAYHRGHEVLDGLSGTWSRGVHGLLGINGAGKTTMLRLVSTSNRPQSGKIIFGGVEATRGSALREIRRTIGYVPQNASWPGSFTVSEFCSYAAWMRGVPSRERETAVATALDYVGLGDRGFHRLRTLSGGMHQRVMLAQAIVHDPRLLVLDEPTAGLDPQQRLRFRALVRDMSADRLIVLSTHLVEDISAVADDVTVIHDGRFAFRGSTEQLAGLGRLDDPGDTALERGFSRVVSRGRG
jgi:ABC-2 type transport system ATP-binding protein